MALISDAPSEVQPSRKVDEPSGGSCLFAGGQRQRACTVAGAGTC